MITSGISLLSAIIDGISSIARNVMNFIHQRDRHEIEMFIKNYQFLSVFKTQQACFNLELAKMSSLNYIKHRITNRKDICLIANNVWRTAIKLDHHELIKLFLEDRIIEDEFQKIELIQEAARSDSLSCCQVLLDHGLDINSCGYMRYSALHCASSRRIARFLLVKGANVNSVTVKNDTALHIAVKKNLIEVASILIRYGSHINIPNIFGESPLHLAKSRNMSKLLLGSGSNVSAKNNLGETPLHIAAREGNEELISVLIQHGAERFSIASNKRK